MERRAGRWIALTWHEPGTLTGLVESLEARHLCSFRWITPTGQRPRAGNAAPVEMLLTTDAKVVRLELTESGFGYLPVSDDRKAALVRQNPQGGDHALANLRRLARGGEH